MPPSQPPSPWLRIVLAAVLVAVCRPAPLRAAGDADRGAEIFRAGKCPMCHGADGSANTPAGKKFGARDLRSAEVQKLTDAEIKTVIRDGKGKMPSFKDAIADAGIEDLVAFVRKLGAGR